MCFAFYDQQPQLQTNAKPHNIKQWKSTDLSMDWSTFDSYVDGLRKVGLKQRGDWWIENEKVFHANREGLFFENLADELHKL